MSIIVKPVAAALALTCQVVGEIVVGVGIGIAACSAVSYTIETTERTVKKIRNRRHARLVRTVNAVIDHQVQTGQLLRPTPIPA